MKASPATILLDLVTLLGGKPLSVAAGSKELLIVQAVQTALMQKCSLRSRGQGLLIRQKHTDLRQIQVTQIPSDICVASYAALQVSALTLLP